MNPTARLETVRSGRYRLHGVLDFDSVPALYEAAPDVFAEGRALEIELDGVRRSDSAGLALLVEWMRLARRRGQPIRFLNMPMQMLAIARASGLDQILPLHRES